MPLEQAVLDRIRIANKYVTNKMLIHLAGKRSGHFAILSHTGRKSGRVYHIPIIAEPVPGGFVIALTYGKKVDWFANVMAKGSCWLRWKNQDYLLTNPRLIDSAVGVMAFPKIARSVLRTMGIRDYLQLDVQP